MIGNLATRQGGEHLMISLHAIRTRYVTIYGTENKIISRVTSQYTLLKMKAYDALRHNLRYLKMKTFHTLRDNLRR